MISFIWQILGLLLALIGYIYKLCLKVIEIDTININIVSVFIIFVIFLLIEFYKYKVQKNDNNNPFSKKQIKDIFLKKESWILGINGTLMFIIGLIAIKNLPLSLSIPIGLLWLLFSLVINKFINNTKITLTKLLGTIIVIIGVIITSFHHFFNYNNNNQDFKSLVFMISILLFSCLIKAFQVIYVKKIEYKYNYQQVIVKSYGTKTIIALFLYLIYLYFPNKNWEVRFPQKIDLIKLIGIIITLTTLTIFLRYKCIEKLPVSQYNLLTTSIIVFSIIFGKVFFNESIRLNQIIGCFVIFFGIFYTQIIKELHNKSNYPESYKIIDN